MKCSFLIKSGVILCCVFLVCNAASFAQSTTFIYTSSIQTYTVPAGVAYMAITAKGAQGGGNTVVSSAGGHGAIMSGTFGVTPGQVLAILVGGQGMTATYIGGGGGGSFVLDNATHVLLVAAGGGGGGGNNAGAVYNGLDATTDTNGVNSGGGSGGGTAGNGGITPTASDYAGGGTGWLSNGNNGVISVGVSCTLAVGGATPLTGGAGGMYGGDAGSVGSGGLAAAAADKEDAAPWAAAAAADTVAVAQAPMMEHPASFIPVAAAVLIMVALTV